MPRTKEEMGLWIQEMGLWIFTEELLPTRHWSRHKTKQIPDYMELMFERGNSSIPKANNVLWGKNGVKRMTSARLKGAIHIEWPGTTPLAKVWSRDWDVSLRLSGEEPGEGAHLLCCAVSKETDRAAGMKGNNTAQRYSLPAMQWDIHFIPLHKGLMFCTGHREKKHAQYSVVYIRVSKLQPKPDQLNVLIKVLLFITAFSLWQRLYCLQNLKYLLSSSL